MNIVVFIKQVPDTTDVKWTENNNIDRARMDSILNPVDKSAIEAALFFKDNFGANITAITMGPEKAVEVLQEALAMGVDNAVLLSDSKFVGSDTCATSRVLAAVIKEKYSNVDVILFGQSAIDGETSQTGPSTAARLNFPYVTQVNSIMECLNKQLIVSSDTELLQSTIKITLPCVLCINNYVTEPRLPKISGYIKSQYSEIVRYNHSDIAISETDSGIKGSPTWVSKVFKNSGGRMCCFVDDSCLNVVVDSIKEAINK